MKKKLLLLLSLIAAGEMIQAHGGGGHGGGGRGFGGGRGGFGGGRGWGGRGYGWRRGGIGLGLGVGLGLGFGNWYYGGWDGWGPYWWNTPPVWYIGSNWEALSMYQRLEEIKQQERILRNRQRDEDTQELREQLKNLERRHEELAHQING